MIEIRPLTKRQQDLTGKTFNAWTVLSYLGIKRYGKNGYSHAHYWLCRCDCGEHCSVQAGSLIAGTSKRCRRCSHGEPDGWHHPLYGRWTKMRSRCNNPDDADYVYYGVRGIEVCARWDSFGNFLADMGNPPTPDHTLDRIDVDGDYTSKNVRWATRLEQVHNRRR